MYLYNITVFIDPDLETEAIHMVRELEGEGSFRTLKMLDSQHDQATYCLQIQLPDQEAISAFREGPLAHLQSTLFARFEDKVLYHESVMEYL